MQINMLDHVIVGQSFEGRPGYFSFKEAGYNLMNTTKRFSLNLSTIFSQNAGMSLNCRSSLCESFWPWPSSLAALLSVAKKRSLFASSRNVNCA